MTSAAATAALEGRYAVLRAGAAGLTSEELLDVIEQAQREKDAASARQAVALAHLSAREPRLLEDGTTVEVHHGLGHQRLDAPELAAPRMGVSVHVATRRVTHAIDQLTRTPAVVDAMASGDLDEQRAAAVTEETEFLTPESAAAVTALVAPRWRGLTTGPLRRLLARAAATVDPEAVAAHADAERERRGLTRRLGAHGADHWRGDFRVEQARVAWAAVTERARQLVRDGHADTLHLARADAMMELILEHSDVRVVVHTTRAADDPATPDATPDATAAATPTADDLTPDDETDPAPVDADADADAGPMRAGASDGLVEVGGLGAPGTTFVPRSWLDAFDTTRNACPARDLTCDSGTGALLAGDVPEAFASGRTRRSRSRPHPEDPTGTYRIPAEMARLVRLRDGCCRFPGCATPTRQCDLDHVRPWPAGPTAPTNLIALCRRHHRIKQRPGWTVRLSPDGVVTWRDPTGRVHTTWPVDHLHLADGTTARTANAPLTAATTRSPGTFHVLGVLPTTFEEELHHLLDTHPSTPLRRRPTTWSADGTLLTAAPPHIDLVTTPAAFAGPRPWDTVVVDVPPRPPEAIPF